MGISPLELQNVAVMISTVTLAKNYDFEASDSNVQTGHVLCCNGVRCGFQSRQVRSNDNNNRVNLKR